MFCYFGLPIGIRLVLALTSVVAAAWLLRKHSNLIAITRSRIERLSKRPLASLATVFAVSLAVNLILGAIRTPQPDVHDEWAYLLAGDTYASGRLTNPAHPFWQHFETFHVLSQPSYMAKYPPGTGLTLALGQYLFQLPIAGVWIVHSLALAALCWMHRGWISANWSFIGCLLLAINVPMLMGWSQTYWGGSVAMLGGALLLGAVRRIASEKHRSNTAFAILGVSLGIGCVLLAISRPFEGVLLVVVCGAVLFGRLLRQPSRLWRQALAVTIPLVIVAAGGLSWIAFNNQTVTGNAMKLPYSAHAEQYASTSMWIWSPMPELKQYNLERMESLYINWTRARQLNARTWDGFLSLAGKKLNLLWGFFPLLGGICLFPTVRLLKRKDWWFRFAFGVVAAILAIELQLVHSYAWPHYLAPVAGLFYVLLFRGLAWIDGVGRQVSFLRLVAPTAVIYGCFSLAAYAVVLGYSDSESARVVVEQKLEQTGGRHLVFVEYLPDHNLHQENVYNAADIDASDIVWANRLGDDQDRELIKWYNGSRKVWLWRVDSGTGSLKRWNPADIDSVAARH